MDVVLALAFCSQPRTAYAAVSILAGNWQGTLTSGTEPFGLGTSGS
jgi:hypothetical protein